MMTRDEMIAVTGRLALLAANLATFAICLAVMAAVAGFGTGLAAGAYDLGRSLLGGAR